MTRQLLAAALALATVTAAGSPSSVVDDTGYALVIDGPVSRIVTLSPHATELVVASGAAGQLAAIAAGADAPDGLEHLPRIGGNGPIDRERLLAMQPDLVVGWWSGNRQADLTWIRRSGIPLFLSEPAALADIAANLRKLGTLTGHHEAGDLAASRFEAALDTACVDMPPLSVYVNVWPQPAMTLGGRHWLNEVLHRGGYRNVLAEEPLAVFRITPEHAALLQDQPQVTLQRTFDGSAADRLAGTLSRPGPAVADAVRALCARRLAGGVSPRTPAP